MKNSLGCFDNLTKSKNEITINRIENDYIEHYQMPCKDHKHAELQISQQIKKKKKITETIELQEVTSNMLKHSLQNKSLQPPVIGAYDFELIFRDTDDQSKLGELRKNKN